MRRTAGRTWTTSRGCGRRGSGRPSRSWQTFFAVLKARAACAVVLGAAADMCPLVRINLTWGESFMPFESNSSLVPCSAMPSAGLFLELETAPLSCGAPKILFLGSQPHYICTAQCSSETADRVVPKRACRSRQTSCSLGVAVEGHERTVRVAKRIA